MSRRKILISIFLVLTIGVVVTIGVNYKKNKQKFSFNVDIEGREIYKQNELSYYVVNDEKKQDIMIIKNGYPCVIYNVFKNHEGARVFAVYQHQSKTVGEEPIGFSMENYKKPNHYLLFVGKYGRLRHIKIEDYVKQLKWLNDKKIKVIFDSHSDTETIKFFENPL